MEHFTCFLTFHMQTPKRKHDVFVMTECLCSVNLRTCILFLLFKLCSKSRYCFGRGRMSPLQDNILFCELFFNVITNPETTSKTRQKLVALLLFPFWQKLISSTINFKFKSNNYFEKLKFVQGINQNSTGTHVSKSKNSETEFCASIH